MTFLAPVALFGGLLLAIPVLVHLWRPRKMRQTPFSSLRWLKQTHQRLSRRIQWHQWLLFLLRAGFILLLVLALAKPLIGLGSAEGPIDRCVVVDLSRSMAYQNADGQSSLDKARALAGLLLKNPRPVDRSAIVFADASPRVVSPFVADAGVALPDLQAARPGGSDARLTATLPLLPALFPRSDVPTELVFLTDNLPQRWGQGEIQDLQRKWGRPLKINVVDVGPGSAQNAWIASARLHDRGGERFVRVEVACTGAPDQERGVVLQGIAGAVAENRSIRLQPGRLARVDFPIPAELNLAEQVAEIRLEPADALASDDVYYLSLDNSWPLRILLVEPEDQDRDGRNVGLYLSTALEALAGSTRPALDLTTRTATKVTPADFQKTDMILLAGVPELGEASVVGLQSRVRDGAGLVVFLGPNLKPAFYNDRLYNSLQPREGLLPLRLKTEGAGLALSGPAALTNIRWAHPLLAALHDPVLGDLPRCEFPVVAQLTGELGKQDTVLAWFGSDNPALIEHPVGNGRVMVFNTSANDAWTDMPRKQVYIPLLDRMIGYLASGAGRREFMVGEAVNLPLDDYQANESVTIVDPAGVALTPRVITRAGRTLLHLDAVGAPGIYRVERNGSAKKSTPFAVNVGRGDATLATMDEKALREWWSPAEVEVLHAEEAAQRFAASSNSWGLWPALILVAGVLLLLETIYVHRLCPRVNPAVTHSVVQQQGIMKPVG